MKPIDPKLNEAILRIARTINPRGYGVSQNPPSSYDALVAHLDAGKRMVVFDGGSDQTIYASPQVNHAFRAWHDHCHGVGHNDFSIEGEIATWKMQCLHLYLSCGRTLRTRYWAQLLHAEVVGQRLYFARHKNYIHNQRAFVETFLDNPEAALAQPASNLKTIGGQHEVLSV